LENQYQYFFYRKILIVINIGCSGSGASNEKTKRKRKCDEAATTELGKKQKKPETNRDEVTMRTTPSKKHVQQMRDYIDMWKQKTCTMASDKLKAKMKEHLNVEDMKECRLNVYWKNPACGCTSRSVSKDVAHFSFVHMTHLNYTTRLAMSLKCSEMFATWSYELDFVFHYTCDRDADL
jgi:hypothetical protein